ncbi:MAG: hypothetical protein NHB32_28715 [Fischerella sp. CENA71]|nr:hypothetical protein [Fischerella sp. CENA71]
MENSTGLWVKRSHFGESESDRTCREGGAIGFFMHSILNFVILRVAGHRHHPQRYPKLHPVI